MIISWIVSDIHPIAQTNDDVVRVHTTHPLYSLDIPSISFDILLLLNYASLCKSRLEIGHIHIYS